MIRARLLKNKRNQYITKLFWNGCRARWIVSRNKKSNRNNLVPMLFQHLLRNSPNVLSKDRWYKWQYGKRMAHQHIKNLKLPMSIKELLKSIFMELSSDTLLAKCLHGKTQNVSESFNVIVWSKCLKLCFAVQNIFSWYF